MQYASYTTHTSGTLITGGEWRVEWVQLFLKGDGETQGVVSLSKYTAEQ